MVKATLLSLMLTGASVIWSAVGLCNSSPPQVTTILVPSGGQAVTAKATADGALHLLYNAADGPQYVRSLDNGSTFSPPLTVVDSTSRKPGLTFAGADMAVGKDGRVYVAMSTNAWKLKLPTEEWSVQYAMLEPGAKAFSPVRNLNRKSSEGFSLAANGKGEITAAWLSGKLYANVSVDNGQSFTPNAEINSDYDPCDCCTTSAIYGVDGKLAVLYREETNNERDMYLILWDQKGKQEARTRVSSTPWRIAGCPMSAYTINQDGDGYVAAWPTKGEVYFARLDSQGKVLAPGEIKTPGRAGMRAGILALSAADRSTLIAWKSEGELGWQLYDAQGRPRGASVAIKSAGNGAAGVVDKNGNFILFR